MGLFDPFFELIRSLFGSFFYSLPVGEPDPEPPTGFQRKIQTQNDTEQVGVNIRATKEVRENNGRYPEWMFATYLSNALDEAGVNYDITWGYETAMVPPTERAVCGDVDSDTAYRWWESKVRETTVPVAPHSNILITNAKGGGCGLVGGNVATVPGYYLDHYEDADSGTSDFHSNIQSCLHEFIHNMGGGHDMDPDKPGNQYPGLGWNEDGKWHQTPGYAGGSGENMCGEFVPEKQHETIVRHQYFHDCTVELFYQRFGDGPPNEHFEEIEISLEPEDNT